MSRWCQLAAQDHPGEVVVFMQAALAALLFVRLAVRRYLTPAHQLRRYLL